MHICAAVNCNIEIATTRKYCSASCRTKTTNALYKDYKAQSEGFKNKRNRRPIKYCNNCSVILTFEQRWNVFCSHSCSAAYTNKYRTPKKYTMSEQGRSNIRAALERRIRKPVVELTEKVCPKCNASFKKYTRYCSKTCANRSRKSSNEFRQYRLDCNFKFALNSYPDRFDFSLIEQFGWYSPSNKRNNIGGVSRDHMLSIKDGYLLGVPPDIMSHPANCQLMVHSMNISKNKKSSITYNGLLQRIAWWDALDSEIN